MAEKEVQLRTKDVTFEPLRVYTINQLRHKCIYILCLNNLNMAVKLVSDTQNSATKVVMNLTTEAVED